MNQVLSIPQINRLNRAEFIDALGNIFEHSPWVAQQAYDNAPFDSLDSLLNSMQQAVNNASQAQRIKLIHNHPELAGRAAQAGELTTHSKIEQAGAGLDHCSIDELQKLRHLNKQYRDKFGFPFVIAVKQLTRDDILQALESRLHNSPEQEFENCLQQINRIAEFRLKQLITD